MDNSWSRPEQYSYDTSIFVTQSMKQDHFGFIEPKKPVVISNIFKLFKSNISTSWAKEKIKQKTKNKRDCQLKLGLITCIGLLIWLSEGRLFFSTLSYNKNVSYHPNSLCLSISMCCNQIFSQKENLLEPSNWQVGARTDPTKILESSVMVL